MAVNGNCPIWADFNGDGLLDVHITRQPWVYYQNANGGFDKVTSSQLASTSGCMGTNADPNVLMGIAGDFDAECAACTRTWRCVRCLTVVVHLRLCAADCPISTT